MTNSDVTPTMARRYLGETLQRMRLDAEMELDEVSTALGKNRRTITRWESGATSPDVSNIRSLCDLYGIPKAQYARLTALLANSKSRNMYESPSVPDDLRWLVDTELSAAMIRSIELEYVPGLLQTPEYHRAAQARQLPAPEKTRAEFRKLRTQRQERVFAPPAPTMHFVLGPAVLYYLDQADDSIREGQMQRLVDASRLEHVEIRVITNFHPAMLGGFTIVNPRPTALGARPFAYCQDMSGARYMETSDVLSQCETVFSAVWENAIALEEHLP